MAVLSARSYNRLCYSSSWEEIWEAGPYYERLSELLEDARHYVIFSGWQIDSRLPLPRPVRPGSFTSPGVFETLRHKILRLCKQSPGLQLYFLIWDHSYLYLPERELWQGRVWDDLHPNVHFVFDNRHALGGAHHEKICIFDGKIALCGGIDLCDDRWDAPEHLYTDPRRSLSRNEDHHGPYHDLGIQVTGSACAELQRHLQLRWEAISSIRFPHPEVESRGGHAVYLSRTQSGPPGKNQPPTLIREIEFLFRDLVETAEKSLVFEGQYFWSRRIADLLMAKMLKMRGRDFEIVLILAELSLVRSFTRKMAPYEMSLLAQLMDTAQATGTRLIMGAPYSHPPKTSPKRPPRPIYIHSKLMIVDDRYLSVGSANLAARAQRIDTEVALTLEARTPSERAHVRWVSNRVLSHWGLQGPPGHLRLHHFSPIISLRQHRETWPRYSRLFDPDLPIGYLLKRKLCSLIKRNPWKMRGLLLISTWSITTTAILELVSFGQTPMTGAIQVWAATFGATWFFPCPPLLLALLAAPKLGIDITQKLLVSTIWVSSLVGYWGGRTLPEEYRLLSCWLPGPLSREKQIIHIQKCLGQRTFSSLLIALFDPRLGFRIKTTYLGICFTPLPWFILACWILWPAICALAFRATVIGVQAWL